MTSRPPRVELAVKDQLACDATNGRVREIADELDEGIGGEALPSVGEDENSPRAARDARVERRRLAARRQVNEANPIEKGCKRPLRRIDRSVGDDDDLAFARVSLVQEVGDARREPRSFVSRRNDDGNRGPRRRRRNRGSRLVRLTTRAQAATRAG